MNTGDGFDELQAYLDAPTSAVLPLDSHSVVPKQVVVVDRSNPPVLVDARGYSIDTRDYMLTQAGREEVEKIFPEITIEWVDCDLVKIARDRGLM